MLPGALRSWLAALLAHSPPLVLTGKGHQGEHSRFSQTSTEEHTEVQVTGGTASTTPASTAVLLREPDST